MKVYKVNGEIYYTCKSAAAAKGMYESWSNDEIEYPIKEIEVEDDSDYDYDEEIDSYYNEYCGSKLTNILW